MEGVECVRAYNGQEHKRTLKRGQSTREDEPTECK